MADNNTNNKKIWLASPHMSDEGYEQEYVKEAFDTNWKAPLEPNVNGFEKELAAKVGIDHAAAFHGIDLPETTHGNSIQFVADNVDHNTATLDGRNTFHGMGMIAVVTPGVRRPKQIPRKNVSLQDVQAIGQIGVYFYR